MSGYWQTTGRSDTMRQPERSDCEGGADVAEEAMTAEQRLRFRQGVVRTEHSQCLNCASARRPSAPAPGLCVCRNHGELVDVTAYCKGWTPAGQRGGSGAQASCSASTTATKSHA